MATLLFDERRQAMFRARAARRGWRSFLHARAVEDMVDRLSFIQRDFTRAIVVGCPHDIRELTQGIAAGVEFRDSPADLSPANFGQFDLAMLAGGLEAANDPRLVLHAIRACLVEDALVLGALVGGDSLPLLRRAMLTADTAEGRGVSPHVHPRIEAASVAPLVADAGFSNPVVDVDRVALQYRALDGLVADLRGMGASNALLTRAERPIGRAGLAAAHAVFAEAGGEEQVDLIHFAGWTPALNNRP